MNFRLNARQITAAKALLANANQPGSIYDFRRVSSTFKHDLNFDFGYPRTAELNFVMFYELWRRNGFARALVEKTTSKTWQDNPSLWETEDRDGKETGLERQIRQHFDDIRFWQQLQVADARSMVGKYSGVIFQLADGLPYQEPVKRVPGGIKGVVSILPAWEGQLEPSQWDGDPQSPTYGQPTMFRFNESSVDPENGKIRSFTVHPDRCLIWSSDGTTFGDSKLEPCYNALMDMEKIRGAGGEGFWKNAKSQPILQAGADVDFAQLASMLGTDMEGIADALDEVIGRWSKGFDDSLVLQGMEAKNLSITLPEPEEFFNVALQEVAASWPIPQKILVGMQTGERASTEDAREWAQICMSRRTNVVIPNIMEIVRRFEHWGMLPESDWFLDWPDLTAPTLEEKLAIGDRMAKINQAMFAMGEAVFSADEIRDVADYDSLEASDLSEPDEDDLEDDPEGES